MNRPCVAKLLGLLSIILFLSSIGLSLPTRAATFTSSTTYTLRFLGYDFDGQYELTLSLNGGNIAQFPAIFVTGNAVKYVQFFFGPFSLLNGVNQIRFTHAPYDLSTPDYVKNLTLTSSLGQIVYSNSSIYPTVPGPLTYSFNPFTSTSPLPPPHSSLNSTGTGTISGAFSLHLSPSSFTLTGLAANVSRTLYLNLTNTGGSQANMTFTLSPGTLPGGSFLSLGSCGTGPIGNLPTYTLNGQSYPNLCLYSTTGLGLNLVLPAGYEEMLALTVTAGPASVYASTYSFSVTVKGR